MNPRTQLLLALSAAAALAAWLARPVSRPDASGRWIPAEQEHSKR